MRVVAFVDLDDTLFQTRPKCPEGEEVCPAAYRRDGTPLSFMTGPQKRLFEWLSATATVVPTTARNLDAFRRVRLAFSSFAVLDFGGVVLMPDGTPDADWDREVRPRTHSAGRELEAWRGRVQRFVDDNVPGVSVRLIADLDMPLYLVMKHPAGDLDALGRIAREALTDLDQERFFVHANDNNLSVVPRFLGKERAVRHILTNHLAGERVLALGVGDSLTDAGFLNLCDFALLPRDSQLGRLIR